MTAHYDKAARGRDLDCSISEGRIPTCTGRIQPAITECEWKRDLVDETEVARNEFLTGGAFSWKS